jgi:hypothetical protein
MNHCAGNQYLREGRAGDRVCELLTLRAGSREREQARWARVAGQAVSVRSRGKLRFVTTGDASGAVGLMFRADNFRTTPDLWVVSLLGGWTHDALD